MPSAGRESPKAGLQHKSVLLGNQRLSTWYREILSINQGVMSKLCLSRELGWRMQMCTLLRIRPFCEGPDKYLMEQIFIFSQQKLWQSFGHIMQRPPGNLRRRSFKLRVLIGQLQIFSKPFALFSDLRDCCGIGLNIFSSLVPAALNFKLCWTWSPGAKGQFESNRGWDILAYLKSKDWNAASWGHRNVTRKIRTGQWY